MNSPNTFTLHPILEAVQNFLLKHKHKYFITSAIERSTHF